MSRRKILAGTTSLMLPIFIQDTTSPVGAGLGSLVYNSSGLAARYRRQGSSAWTSITLATATVGTFTSGGFKEDTGGTTGSYEVGVPDAAVASGAAWVIVEYYGVTNMLPVRIEFELDAINYQDGVRAGLTSLPNAAAEASGGLYTRGTGAGQINQDANGRINTNVTAFGGSAGTFSGGRPEVNTSHWGGTAIASANVLIDGAITAAKIATDAITDAKVAGDVTIASVTGAVGSVTGSVGSVTGNVGGNIAGNVNGNVAGSVGSVTGWVGGSISGNVVGSVGSVTGSVGGNVVGSVGSLGTQAKLDVNAEADAALADAGVTTTVTGRIDAAISTRLAAASYTVPLDAAGVRSAVGLASANLDTQLGDLPTNAELTTALGTADDATLAAIAALNNLSAAQVNAEVDTALADVGLTSTVTGRIDATVSSRSSQASVDTLTGYVDTEVAAIKAKTDNLPTDPADQSAVEAAITVAVSGLSTLDAAGVRSAVGLAAANLDTQLNNIPDHTDLATRTLPSAEYATSASVASLGVDLTSYLIAVQAKTDQLPSDPASQQALETYIDTAVSGIGGGGLDAAGVRAAIGLASANLDTQLGDIPTVAEMNARTLPSASYSTLTAAQVNTEADTALADVGLTSTVTGRIDAAVSTRLATAGYTAPLDAAGVRTAVGLASANLDSQLGDLPTNAELTAALASADDATLAAISTLASRTGVPSNLGSGATIADNLVDIHSDGSGGGAVSTGARTVTVTVTDDSDVPLQNATVRVTQGAESYVLGTNASGVVSFSLDDATWTVSITKYGYQFSPVSLVVDENETITYTMSQIVPTPSTPGLITGYLVCYDNEGVVESGVTVYLKQLEPATDSGVAYDGDVRSAVSDAEGLVEFTGLFLGGRYHVYRDQLDERPVMFTIADDQTDPMELPSVISRA